MQLHSFAKILVIEPIAEMYGESNERQLCTEIGSFIALRHNYRHNQVHCTWFRVCIYCGSGGVAITRN